MRIQIISKESDKSWYANHIGDTFTIIWEMDSTYLVETNYGPMAIGKKHVMVLPAELRPEPINPEDDMVVANNNINGLVKAPKFGVKHLI